MITKRQKNKIKKGLGKYYVAKVKTVLEADNIKDSSGKTHSTTMITNVMNGTPHEVIEKAIYKALELSISEKSQEELRRKKLLEAVE